jgi:hypothetical protein
VCNEDGTPVFTDDDIPAVQGMPSRLIQEVIAVSGRLAGWRRADGADENKAGTGGASPSPSDAPPSPSCSAEPSAAGAGGTPTK